MTHRHIGMYFSVNMTTAQAVVLAVVMSTGAAGNALAQPKPAANGQRNLSVQPTQNNPANTKDQRVALVIGNSAYKEAPLANPVNDARAIARALADTGFQVTIKENSDQKTMLAALREFGEKLRNGGTGLFYYAGHGMQIKGRNYLIPVSASIEHEDEVAYAAVDAQAVLDKMESAGNGANIMILDACRNNPFVRSTRSGQVGLAQMDAPVGTLVAYATSPGAVASDGAGRNGLYTQHLLNAMRQPGNKLEDVFKQVRAGVRKDSQGKQIPWESTSLEGDFYFSAPPAALTPTDPRETIESALWDAVKGSSVAVELQAYLARYPQGRYAKEAQAQLTRLQTIPAPPAATAPAVSTPLPPVHTSIDEISNDSGFHVGDSWNFQVVDPDAKKTLSQGERKITKIQANQTFILNEGAVKWAADGSEFYRDFNDGQRQVNENGFRRYPLQWKVGFTESTQYKRYGEGERKNYDDDVKTELHVVAQEPVHIPAGTFAAWKVVIDTSITRRIFGKFGSSSIAEHEVCWYVPALKIYAACDKEVQFPGERPNHERTEVTSFSFPSATP